MKILILRAMALVVAAASLLLAADPAAAQIGGMRDANFGGVSFRYDASLADGVEAKLVPETPAGPDLPYWVAAPRHLEFTLTNFHGASTRAVPASVYVFPVRSDYTSLTPGGNHDNWLPMIQALKSLLAKQPDLRSEIEQVSTEPSYTPGVAVLPPVNAATVLVGKAGYLSFRNGIGTRYLIQGSQDVSPPDRDNTFYAFQGLTSDGKYFVAAFFSAFPTAMQPIEPFQGNNIRSYYLNLIDRFDAIANDAYTPNLDNLDKMIGSLSVHPTDINEIPGMPSTGAVVAGPAILGLVVFGALLIIAGWLLTLRKSS